jgi:MinD superfamily P-loop ATPase
VVILDAPLGTACPVISASSGMDAAVLAVEPPVSGAHDLDRVLATTAHFGVPALVAINKADPTLVARMRSLDSVNSGVSRWWGASSMTRR